MRAQRRGRWPFLLVLLIVGTAVACEAPAPEPEGLRLAVRADVTGFFPNPPASNEGYTIDINWHVLEGLVGYDPALQLEPALAVRWENPDDRTYVFDLRPGVRFSNGQELTARDVVASLEAARQGDWFNRGYLQAVESVRALDEWRVEIRTSSPYLILLFKLPFGVILPADSLDEPTVPTIGTGPYLLEAWEPGRGFVLERNPHFRGPAAPFPRASFDVVPDGEARVAMLLEGKADVIDQVPLDWLDRLEARDDVSVVSGPGLRNLFLGLRVDVPPFSDPRLREAVDLAIDRQELIERALWGRAQPASQIVPAAIVGYDPQLQATQPDRERARQLVVQAGHADGLRIRLDGPNNRYVNDAEILVEVGRQLALVGIDVEVNALDKKEFFALIDSQQSRFHLLGYACRTGEAGDALDTLFHSPGDGRLGSNNTFGVADPELDRLIQAANGSRRMKERTANLRQAVRRAAELRATLPLVVQTEALAFSKRLDWQPSVGYELRVEDMRPSSP